MVASLNPAGMIGGVIFDVISRSIKQVGNDPSVPQLSSSDATIVQQEVIATAARDPQLKELSKVVENATNSEPWYQSRVTWGAIIAFASPLLAQIIGRAIDPAEQAMWISILTAGGAMVGGLISWYGRWVAKKPLGS